MSRKTLQKLKKEGGVRRSYFEVAAVVSVAAAKEL
jgi:hypothetical protein